MGSNSCHSFFATRDHLIDIIATAPGYVILAIHMVPALAGSPAGCCVNTGAPSEPGHVVGVVPIVRTVRLLRVLRLAKVARHAEAIRITVASLSALKGSLVVVVALVIFVTLIVATVAYFVELEGEDTGF